MAKANAGQALKAAQARIVTLEQEVKDLGVVSSVKAASISKYIDSLQSELQVYRHEITALQSRVLNDSLRIRRLQHKYTQACLLAVATTAVLVVDIVLTIWG